MEEEEEEENTTHSFERGVKHCIDETAALEDIVQNRGQGSCLVRDDLDHCVGGVQLGNALEGIQDV